NDAALAELARVQVRDALKRWVPEAELVEVNAVREGVLLQLKVRFRAAKDAGKAATTEEVQLSLEG
ncbi:MAG: hypothetical protein JXA57_16280, partial [Armatimonadetes bacterium]|nr:hypothetical protein [Armatimonadota bacterium]